MVCFQLEQKILVSKRCKTSHLKFSKFKFKKYLQIFWKNFKLKKKGSPRLKLVIHKLCLESIWLFLWGYLKSKYKNSVMLWKKKLNETILKSIKRYDWAKILNFTINIFTFLFTKYKSKWSSLILIYMKSFFHVQ